MLHGHLFDRYRIDIIIIYHLPFQVDPGTAEEGMVKVKLRNFLFGIDAAGADVDRAIVPSDKKNIHIRILQPMRHQHVMGDDTNPLVLKIINHGRNGAAAVQKDAVSILDKRCSPLGDGNLFSNVSLHFFAGNNRRKGEWAAFLFDKNRTAVEIPSLSEIS